MRIVYYIGQPGVGKTTLMRRFLDEYRRYEPDEFVKEGLITYHKFEKQKMLVLGRYDDGVFAGTDTWSKGVGPKFREWLLENRERYAGWTAIGEGERLSNQPNLDAMFAEESMRLICLEVNEEELERRRAARNNTQDPKWMKGMRTRMENLKSSYPHEIVIDGHSCGHKSVDTFDQISLQNARMRAMMEDMKKVMQQQRIEIAILNGLPEPEEGWENWFEEYDITPMLNC